MPQTLPYGSWPSPVTAASVAAASPHIEGARFVAGEVWWGETVPDEGGRTAVRRRTGTGQTAPVLPAPWNARSRVHEYGGGAWTATDAGVLVFVEKTDQRIHRLDADGAVRPLTPAEGGMRFGDLTIVGDEVWAVRETHDGSAVPPRDIVAVPLDGSAAHEAAAIRSVVGGSDFLAYPRVSPDGSRLAWIAWDHPDMPWDATQLRIGALVDGRVAAWSPAAGAVERASVLQPEWTTPAARPHPAPARPEPELCYVTDASGRWNLERIAVDGATPAEAVAPADADTGGALWNLGARWYRPLDDGRIIAVRTDGGDRVVVIDPAAGSETELPIDATAAASVEDARGTRVLVSAAGVDGPPALWLVDVDDPGGARRMAGAAPAWDAEWMPQPRAVTTAGPHGPVHAFDYPPTSPVAIGPAGALPPYVVLVHGGPTSHVAAAASGKVVFFTSRGIGVLDVNYGGSTGYGRAYRERLRGQWGVVDVDDVAAAAAGLAAAGRADPARLAIEGGSAGGWTVLAALANTDVFAAGISRYGVGDARTLAADTHDFEARYLDGLIGPLPEAEAVYAARSPLTHPERFRVPVLLLQGDEDAVVPPAQSEAIRDALAARGVPHAYVLYAGEGHGFRRRETTIDVLEKELAFLGAVFGFETPGIPPIALD